MKYLYLFVLFFASIANVSDLRANNDNVKAYVRYEVNAPIIMQVINNISNIISINKKGYVAERFLYVKEKIDNGKLLILTSAAPSKKDIRTVACFYPPKTNGYDEKVPAIAVDNYLYYLYEKYPSLTYAIIIHEMCHAYDYFTNASNFMLLYTGNELEGYLYEMDAITIEAMFINDYIDTTKYNQTTFEKYLINSLNNDVLLSVSKTFKNIDNNLARRLYGLSTSDLDCTSALTAFNEIGDSLSRLFVFPSSGSLSEKYFSILPIYTYCQFGPQSVRNIVYRKSKEKNNFEIENYPANYNKLMELSKTISPYKEYINLFNAHVDSIFFMDL